MISAWMKGLIIYLLLSGLVMKLVPGKNYERYVSFYMGLILVIMLAKPIFLIFSVNPGDIELIINSIDGYLTFSESDYADKSDINSGGTYYEYALNETIRQECISNGYNVTDVSVITGKNNDILSITLYIEEDIDENNIKNLIYDVYKIDMESIYIVRR